ncbi:MAG: hypothetical protein CVU84_02180 [Firmicutes bacterium HGW-Firmicutes-1]|jgi:hypothetical protein|nr:MAG: hypothetical protein CVU84_02180 [Firmicutes bacterium HGW-Firmicutes-1]
MSDARIIGFDKQLLIQTGIHFSTLLICVALTGILIYCLILFIKLARRGIVALDIYIDQNKIKNKV